MKKINSVIADVLLCSTTLILYSVWNYQLKTSKDGFTITLQESVEPVISDRDIITYNQTSHEITLTEQGHEKIKAMQISIAGKPFVVKLNGNELYNGSFWTPISSKPYTGIVILFFTKNNINRIQTGYPTPEYYEGTDPRNNPEILNHFNDVD